MVQGSEDRGLALETGEPLRILRQPPRQHLERDVAMESGVAGAIHLAHSAFAELGDDVIRPDMRAIMSASSVGLLRGGR